MEQELILLPCGCKGIPCIDGGIDIYKFCFYHGSLIGSKDILMKKGSGS